MPCQIYAQQTWHHSDFVPLLKKNVPIREFPRFSCNLAFFSTVSSVQVTGSSGQNNHAVYLQVPCGACGVGGTGHQQPCACTSISSWSFQTSASSLARHSLMQFLGRWKGMCVIFLCDTCTLGSVFYFNFSARLSQRKNTLCFIAVKGCLI